MPKEDGECNKTALHAEVTICQQALRVIDYTCRLLLEIGAAQMCWMRHLACVTSGTPAVRGKPSLNGIWLHAAAPAYASRQTGNQQTLDSCKLCS